MIGVGAARASSPSSASSRGRATERDCWIALSLVPGIGTVGFARLIGHFGSATAAWAAGPRALVDAGGLGTAAADGVHRIGRVDPRSLATAVVRATERAGGRVVIATDDAYPPALLTLDPRPPTLFVIGPEEAFRRRTVAIVGTRRASGYGLAVASEIAEELARAGVVVVSGLAIGIDGAAHRASVMADAATIAVLPSPIDRVYPRCHRSLAREIVRRGGALVSEIAIGSPIGRPDFARRNRIIAGLAEAVVVVEAPDRSGALLTAAAATSIGRELYAVPGPIDAMASRGCNRLIADQQAIMVTSSAALLRQVGLARDERPPAIETLSEMEGQLLKRLIERSGSIEEMIDRTGHSAASVASGLTLLEARGLVNSFGGATFHPTLAAKRLAKLI